MALDFPELRRMIIGPYAKNECMEVVIDYFLEQQGDKRDVPNLIFRLEGAIEYYKDVRRVYEDEESQLEYDLESKKYDDIGDVDEDRFLPSDEGAEDYHASQEVRRRLGSHEQIARNEKARLGKLMHQCDSLISSLEKKLNEACGLTLAQNLEMEEDQTLNETLKEDSNL